MSGRNRACRAELLPQHPLSHGENTSVVSVSESGTYSVQTSVKGRPTTFTVAPKPSTSWILHGDVERVVFRVVRFEIGLCSRI